MPRFLTRDGKTKINETYSLTGGKLCPNSQYTRVGIDMIQHWRIKINKQGSHATQRSGQATYQSYKMHANDPATRAVLIFKELVCTMVVVGETKVVVECKRTDLN